MHTIVKFIISYHQNDKFNFFFLTGAVILKRFLYGTRSNVPGCSFLLCNFLVVTFVLVFNYFRLSLPKINGFYSERREKQREIFELELKRFIDYILLLFLWIVNGHHINVLKATCRLDAFASKYVDYRFYGSFCEGICTCVVLDVLRPWKRPGMKGMLRLGMGWALAAYRWLCLDFWEAPSGKLLSGPHPFVIL